MVGYYEMANRMVQQVRSIIVNANQVLVPAFAHLKELEPEKIQTMYLNSYRLLFFVAVPTFSILAVSSPFISQIWVGKYENAFVYSAIILSIGWLLNTLCVPAYFASLGTGELKWNLISHVVMGLSNLGIGIAAGISFSGLGVVGAWALSLALGGIILIIAYHVINGLPMKELLPRTSRLLLVSCFVGVLLCYVIFVVGHSLNKPVLSSGIVILCFAITIAVPVWIHPLRKEIMGWIASIKFNKVFAE
jgi:O-antigen/teichoic acid export membrane protein